MSMSDTCLESNGTVRRALFVSPTAVLDPLLHSQGIPHMRELSKRGIEFTLLSMERADWSDEDRRRAAEIKQTLADWGIDWHILRSGRFLGLNPNVVDLAKLIPSMLRLIRRKRIDVVHCRSYLPAFAMLLIRKLKNVRFLFDTRGFYPDEKVLDGSWSRESAKYRFSKWLEAKCFRDADAIVVVNSRMRDILLSAYSEPEDRADIDRKLTVIPNCTDTERFRPDATVRTTMREQYGLQNRTVFLWLVGRIRPIHMPAESVAFFQACKEHLGDCVLLALTLSNDAEEILRSHGLSDGDYLVRSAPSHDVPRFLQMADVGFSFMVPSHHGSPVKLAEYLAAGIPIALNQGQPGFDDLVDAAGAGVVVRSCAPEGYSEAARELAALLRDREALAQRCRTLAEREFSLHSAVDKYENIYRTLFC